MASTFTTNKSIEKPASGDYNNAWAAPVNADWDDIDVSFGGNTAINVTGVGGATALTITQYRPPNIVFTGTLSTNLVYVIPAGVGGVWSVYNNTTGAFTLSLAVAGGGGIGLSQGQRTTVVSDGSNFSPADTAAAAAAQSNAEAFATAADTVVTTNANAFASSAASTAQSNAESFASNGANITGGTVAAARLPLIGNLSGVTIAADPGTVPSGAAGDMWFYY
jgi:hypothetical protein